jgi:methyltransferase (TIGR00027 family)
MTEQPVLPAGIGLTALAVADARARESTRPDRLFDDPFAHLFVEAAGADFTPAASEGSVDIRAARAEYVAVRTRFFDDELLAARAAGCRQVVILAAGLDTRALRLPWPDGTRLFELDVPDVLAFKARVLGPQAATPSCERLVVAVDLREDWPAALRQAAFDASQPTAWVAEGILMYLSEPERDHLLETITSLSPPASRLALEPPAWQLSPHVAELVARGVVDRQTLAQVAETIQSAPTAQAPSVADPTAWLAQFGWTARLYDAAERFQTYGRPTPAMFSTIASTSPRRGLVSATRQA